jgi:hypothetical protein
MSRGQMRFFLTATLLLFFLLQFVVVRAADNDTAFAATPWNVNSSIYFFADQTEHSLLGINGDETCFTQTFDFI